MAILSPPSARLDKIINFRDVASIPNATPSSCVHIKLGLLFRSARPDAASSQDEILLKETYKIHTILDLRTETEQLEARKKCTNAQVATTPAIQPRPIFALRTVNQHWIQSRIRKDLKSLLNFLPRILQHIPRQVREALGRHDVLAQD